jgi:hypothetical protein
MASGSLTIGGTTFDYGNATGWSTSTAGLLMECNKYTEICVHDANTRVASLMHYDGVNNKILIGRNKGWAETQTEIVSNLTLAADKWIYSSDSSRQRIYFQSNGATIYQGYGAASSFSINHEWRNDSATRTMYLTNSGNLIFNGVLNCKFITISRIQIENTSVQAQNNTTLFCIQGTFTGFHRVFTEDEIF